MILAGYERKGLGYDGEDWYGRWHRRGSSGGGGARAEVSASSSERRPRVRQPCLFHENEKSFSKYYFSNLFLHP